MKLTKLAAAMVLAVAAAGTQVALADGPDERALWEMLIKSSMMRQGKITKSEFMKYMGERFDAMDKGRTGTLTAKQIEHGLDPTRN